MPFFSYFIFYGLPLEARILKRPMKAATLFSPDLYARLRTALIFLILLSIGMAILAQPLAPRFRKLDVIDGMPESSANVMMQDPQGFVWIGTQNGLLKYDGYDFKVFLPHEDDDSSGLYPIMHSVSRMAEDQQGKIWLASSWDGGLASLDPQTERFTNYLTKDTLLHGIAIRKFQTFNLHIDRQNQVWVVTAETVADSSSIQLKRFNQTEQRFYTYDLNAYPGWDSKLGSWDPINFEAYQQTLMAEDEQGHLWVADFERGVYQYKPREDSFVCVLHPDSLGLQKLYPQLITQLRVDQQQRLWISGEGGIQVYDLSSGQSEFFPFVGQHPGTALNEVVAGTYEDQWGQIWVMATSGPLRFDANQGAYLPSENFNTESFFFLLPVAEDSSGIWFTKWRGRAISQEESHVFLYYHHPSQQVKPYNSRFNQPDNESVLQCRGSSFTDQSGLLWIGLGWGGVFVRDPAVQRIQHYSHRPGDPHSLSIDTIAHIFEDSKQRLWFGSLNGLILFDQETGHFETFPLYPDDPNSLSNGVIPYLEDEEGYLWLGGRNGVMRFDPLQKQFSRVGPSEPTYGLKRDKQGNIWGISALGRGLYQYDSQSRKVRRQFQADPQDSSSLITNNINGSLEDRRGNIWYPSYTEGISRWEPQRQAFAHYYPGPPFSPNHAPNLIHDMFEDSRGDIWLGTNGHGVARY